MPFEMVSHPSWVLPWIVHSADGVWRHFSARDYIFQKNLPQTLLGFLIKN